MDILTIVIKIKKAIKTNFYFVCKSLGITPMRTVLILIERFSDGKIDATPIVADYKTFKEQDRINRQNRILKYRIDGGKAYRLNQSNKKNDI